MTGAPPAPPARPAGTGRAAYCAALVVGLLAALHAFPPGFLAGTGGWWPFPGGDVAQSLAGHLAFQRAPWSWPPFGIPAFFEPRGASVVWMDSGPLVSLLAKARATLAGDGPANALGLWYGAAWALQPVAAVWALRGLGCRSWPAALAAAGLLALAPPLWFRFGHPNLVGHFLPMLSLGLALRLAARASRRGWAAMAGLLALGALLHPYLLAMAAAWAPLPALAAWRAGDRALARAHAAGLAAALAALAALLALGGFLGGGTGDKGFGVLSMNLLSPVWPQASGLLPGFGAVLDPTGGQAEGFNWLGLGALAVVTTGLGLRLAEWRAPGPRAAALGLLGLGLALLAVGPRPWAGPVPLFDLGLKPWEDLFAPVRAHGRLFWPVGQALVLAALAVLARRVPARLLAPALALAVLAQWADTAPLRTGLRAAVAAPAPDPLAAFPGWRADAARPGRLVFAPAAPCVRDGLRELSAALTLSAARAGGVALASVPLGRPPPWFNCDAALSDALETPLAPGARLAVLDPALRPRLGAARLGEGVACAPGPGGTLLCAPRGESLPGAAPLAAPLPPLALPPEGAAGDGLAPFLGHGWRIGPGPDGAPAAWSDGPRATLLLPPLPGGGTLRLTLRGVGARPGVARGAVAAAGGAGTVLDLADLASALVRLPLPAAPGPARVTFDLRRPVDPARRGLAAPVRRAGLVLEGLAMEGPAGNPVATAPAGPR